MGAGNPNIAEAGKNTQWQPGQSGNPNGNKPGFRHISTVIQSIGEDPQFVEKYLSKKQSKRYKALPIEIVTIVMYKAAISGDTKAANWLAKHGWREPPQPMPPVEHKFVFVNNVPIGEDDEEGYGQ